MGFLDQQAQPNLRECPQCGKANLPSVEKTMRGREAIKAEMHCDCGADYCFYHSNAHAPGREACIKYHRQVVKEERENMAQVGAQPCPRCEMKTVKTEGCNHM